MAKGRQAKATHVSEIELELAGMLSERGIETTPQLAIGPYNCDLAARPVAVEVFGGHWHWHGHHLARVEERFRHLMDAGWNILVIPVNFSSPLTAAVADYAASYIKATRRDPPAICEYRVVWRAGEFATSGCADDDEISIEPPFRSARDPATGRYKTVAR